MQSRYSIPTRSRGKAVPVLLLVLCSLLSSCALHGTAMPSSGASDSGLTFRDVMGEFCPPAQATKGNC